LVTGLLLLAGVAAAQEGRDAAASPRSGAAEVEHDTWYAQALASSDIGINVTHFWSKGSMLRAETVVLGRRIVTIVDGDTYYAYDGLGLSGLAIGRSKRAMAQDAERARPFGNELAAMKRTGAESIGVEQLGGTEVEVFRRTDRLGRRQLWVTSGAPFLPLQVEIFRRDTGQIATTRYLDWRRGLPISDAFFQPDAKVQLDRMGYDEFVERQAGGKPLGPVPVLYTDLLSGY
jgi:outer membrane lipoprotein-sorting protein